MGKKNEGVKDLNTIRKQTYSTLLYLFYVSKLIDSNKDCRYDFNEARYNSSRYLEELDAVSRLNDLISKHLTILLDFCFI